MCRNPGQKFMNFHKENTFLQSQCRPRRKVPEGSLEQCLSISSTKALPKTCLIMTSPIRNWFCLILNFIYIESHNMYSLRPSVFDSTVCEINSCCCMPHSFPLLCGISLHDYTTIYKFAFMLMNIWVVSGFGLWEKCCHECSSTCLLVNTHMMLPQGIYVHGRIAGSRLCVYLAWLDSSYQLPRVVT